MTPEPTPVQGPRRRKPLLPLGIFLVVCIAAGYYIWKSQASNPGRTEALKTARAGDFARAETDLKTALEANPSDAEVAEALAKGYIKLNKPAEAEIVLDRWVELRPNDREALRHRFEFHRKAKDLAKSYPDGKKLYELEPTNAQLLRVLMAQSFSLGRFEEAEGFCRTALVELPADRTLRSMLAEIRRARDDFTGAGAILDDLLKEFPTHVPALMARGTLYLDAGEPAKAVPLLREVFRIDPTRQRTAGYKLAAALEQTGGGEEAGRITNEVRRLQAVAIAEEGIASEPDNLGLATRHGKMLLDAGYASEGVHFLGRVLTRNPDFPAAHRALADHYEKTGQLDKAAEHRTRAGL